MMNTSNVLLRLVVTLMVTGMVDATFSLLYSFKAGNTVYLCPGLQQDTVCGSGNNKNVEYKSLTTDQCFKIILAIQLKKAFGSIKCPDSKGKDTLENYINYGCDQEKGWKFSSISDKKPSQCSCPAGYCGIRKCGGGGGYGDPHFETHDGTVYDFHGECDLVMARSKHLLSGLDIDVHARTKDMGGWTLLSNVAIRVGDETFEVDNEKNQYLNGAKIIMDDSSPSIYLSNTYKITKSIQHLDYTNETIPEERYRTWYIMELENEHKIYINRFSDMLTVRVDAHLHDTEGMLGTPTINEGLVSRNGQLHVDPNEMGMEWQVTDTEPMLFREIRAPQYPQKCIFYDPPVESENRRLRLTNANHVEQASQICANVPEKMKSSCIHDVIVTGNPNAVHVYHEWEAKPHV